MNDNEIFESHLMFVSSPKRLQPKIHDYFVVVASTNEILGLVYKSNVIGKYLFKSYEKCIFNQKTLKIISDFIIQLEP